MKYEYEEIAEHNKTGTNAAVTSTFLRLAFFSYIGITTTTNTRNFETSGANPSGVVED